MRLSDIMQTRVASVRPEDSLVRAQTLMAGKGIRHLVVSREGAVVGVLSTRDIGRGRRAEGLAVADVMSKAPVTGRPDMSLRQAAVLMRGRSIGCLPLVDGGRVVGIVTASDLLEAIGRGVEKPVIHRARRVLTRPRPYHGRSPSR